LGCRSSAHSPFSMLPTRDICLVPFPPPSCNSTTRSTYGPPPPFPYEKHSSPIKPPPLFSFDNIVDFGPSRGKENVPPAKDLESQFLRVELPPLSAGSPLSLFCFTPFIPANPTEKSFLFDVTIAATPSPSFSSLGRDAPAKVSEEVTSPSTKPARTLTSVDFVLSSGRRLSL